MSFLSGRVAAPLLIASLIGCADTNASPVAPTGPAVVVTSIVPREGSISGGTAVTISGSGFREGATVTFSGTAATDVRVISGTLMYATTPAHAAGDVDVAVSNPDGRRTTRSVRYHYIDIDDSDSCPGCWDY
jgi:IPT/TIG domain